MKKLTIIMFSLFGLVIVANAQSIATNITVTIPAGHSFTRLALTNVIVTQVTITTGTQGAVVVNLFDHSAATNAYSQSEYVSVGSYRTNIAQNYITTTGITNFMTNSYTFTFLTTNATAAVTLPSQRSYSVSASSTQDNLDQRLNFQKGVVVGINTNATITLQYRTEN